MSIRILLLPSLLLLVLASVIFVHFWQLDSIPTGLTLDESFQGITAISLLNERQDMDQIKWPLFLRGFNDYRGAIFTYFIAGIFGLFYPSIYFLRAASATSFCLSLVFFIITIWCFFKNLNQISKYLVLIFGAIAFGFLPWLFTFSRLSYEVNAQNLTLSLALLLTFVTFHSKLQLWKRILLAMLTGGIFGLTMFSYATARMLVPLLLFSMSFIYLRGKYAISAVLILIFSGLAASPIFLFARKYPQQFNARFQEISYIHRLDLSIHDKIEQFISNYAAHLSPRFLLCYGDQSPQHSTHYGGVLYVTVLLFAFISLASVMHLYKKRDPRGLYIFWLIIGLFLSLVPTAMTNQGIPHALRSYPAAHFFLLLSTIGFGYMLATITKERLRVLLGSLCILLLLREAALYSYDYFVRYPDKSVVGSAFFNAALKAAMLRQPQQLLLSGEYHSGYSYWNYNFEIEIERMRTKIPIGFIDIHKYFTDDSNASTIEHLRGKCVITSNQSESQKIQSVLSASGASIDIPYMLLNNKLHRDIYCL